MCDICSRVKPSTTTPTQREKEIKQIYKEMLVEEKRWNRGRILDAATKRQYMHDAEYEWESDNVSSSNYGDDSYGVLYAVECCGVREMSARQAECAKGFKLLLSEVSRKGRFGYLFATTTQVQKPAAKALEARGFEKTGVFSNPNTGNTVTFWVYNIRPIKKEKKSGEEKGDARVAA